MVGILGRHVRRHIVAYVALFVALGGTSYGALRVTSANIVTGGVHSSDIKNNDVGSVDVRNYSLLAKDFKRGQLPQGPQGLQGPQGPPGPVALGQLLIADSGQVFYGPSDVVKGAIAFCPAGYRAVSGGGVNVGDEQLAATEPTNDRSGWFVIGVDKVNDGGEYVEANALCAPTGQAVAATSRSRVRRQVNELAAKLRANVHR